MKLHLNGLVKHACDSWPNEVCGFLFSSGPYSLDEEWYFFPVSNDSMDPENEWIPNRKDMLAVKAKAMKMGLTKIGNIHSHPFHGLWDETHFLPSAKDLTFARRFNDIIRGIVVVGQSGLYDIKFHDKFGKRIEINIEGVE